jgi:competence protein ComEA
MVVSPPLPRLIFAVVVLAGSATRAAGDDLKVIEGCTLVPAEWADGDSFRICTPEGIEHTVRLYGADCLEHHIGNESDARRLRSQRRYFGVTAVQPDPSASIGFAKEFGRAATEETARLLQRPFTVHTAFADARGDGRYKRIYGFVFDADGRDLAAHLVSRGLARAYGVSRATLAGQSGDDYRAVLADLELRAAKEGVGIWAHTDWESLPAERQLDRDEARDLRSAIGPGELPPGFLLDPNMASRNTLMRLPGIGETLANRIIERRPYRRLTDLLEVEGIGPTTYLRLKPFLRLSATESSAATPDEDGASRE